MNIIQKISHSGKPWAVRAVAVLYGLGSLTAISILLPLFALGVGLKAFYKEAKWDLQANWRDFRKAWSMMLLCIKLGKPVRQEDLR